MTTDFSQRKTTRGAILVFSGGLNVGMVTIWKYYVLNIANSTWGRLIWGTWGLMVFSWCLLPDVWGMLLGSEDVLDRSCRRAVHVCPAIDHNIQTVLMKALLYGTTGGQKWHSLPFKSRQGLKILEEMWNLKMCFCNQSYLFNLFFLNDCAFTDTWRPQPMPLWTTCPNTWLSELLWRRDRNT